jgi:hypothetical protein
MKATKGVKTIGEVIAEKPNGKVPARVVRNEKEESAHEEGAPVPAPKKIKKKSSIVAIKHKGVLDRVGQKKNIGKSKRKESLYAALIAEGYSESYARSGQIKKTKSWDKLLEERLGDDKLSNIHSQLMVAKKLDYMLFTAEIKDEDVYTLLESVGCTPKKIVHGIQGTHVWFWAADNRSRKDALELAYKIRGKMSAEVVEIQGGLSALGDAELAALIKKQVAKLTKKD